MSDVRMLSISVFQANAAFRRISVLLVMLMLLFGCNAFDEEPVRQCFPDFGSEPFSSFFNPAAPPDGRFEFPAQIDKNHLCIRFEISRGRNRIQRRLDELGFIVLSPQDFVSERGFCAYVRVTEHPADFYYTTFGNLGVSALGNRNEVEYATPVLRVEGFEGTRAAVLPAATAIFRSDIPLDDIRQFADSVVRANNVELREDTEERIIEALTVPFILTKRSSLGPDELASNLRSSTIVQGATYFLGTFPSLGERSCTEPNPVDE